MCVRVQLDNLFLIVTEVKSTQSYSYLDGLSLGDLCKDAVETAVITEGQIAEVMVGVADDGHGSIWKARCS